MVVEKDGTYIGALRAELTTLVNELVRAQLVLDCLDIVVDVQVFA